MKKTISIILIIITSIIIYFLQSNFFNWFTIAGISPNLFIILILFIGLYIGKTAAVSTGVILGLFLDLLLGKVVGISAIMFGVVGFLSGYLDKNFTKENKMTLMLMVIGTTFVYEFGMYLLKIVILKMNFEILAFTKIMLIEIIYNAILSIILYPIIQLAGKKVEDIFKGKRSITRYL